jgi:hypothetical protein
MDLGGQRTATLILYPRDGFAKQREGGYHVSGQVVSSGEPLRVQPQRDPSALFLQLVVYPCPLTFEPCTVRLSRRILAKTSGFRSCGYDKASTLLPRLMEISIRRRADAASLLW